jgi:6-phosphofructokinase 1
MGIAIMCSGGDAPGMNPAIKRFVDYVYMKNEKPYFIYNGLEGLIDNNIKQAYYKDVSGILHRGGAIIGSSRSKRFYEKNYRKKAYENLLKNNINSLIVLGGDGSFRAMDVFCKEYNIKFMGIPSTIDNDIAGNDYCLGVDTALNVIRDASDKIRDTASTFKRGFVIEVMGRECGYLCATSAVACGAELCLIPEVDLDFNLAKDILKKQIDNGRNYVLCFVAEGVDKTDFMVDWISENLGLETRKSILGYIQRGGNPTVFERLMAFEFIVKAVDKLIAGLDTNKVIVYKDGQFSELSIDFIANSKYTINHHILNMLNFIG